MPAIDESILELRISALRLAFGQSLTEREAHAAGVDLREGASLWSVARTLDDERDTTRRSPQADQSSVEGVSHGRIIEGGSYGRTRRHYGDEAVGKSTPVPALEQRREGRIAGRQSYQPWASLVRILSLTIAILPALCF
jgi:hypothetical protein